MRKPVIVLFLAALLITYLPNSEATAQTATPVRVGFESNEGYNSGNIAGKPSGFPTVWQSNSSNPLFQVTTNVGNKGNALQSSTSSQGYENVTFKPSLTQLGIASSFVPNYTVKFDLRIESEIVASVDSDQWVIHPMRPDSGVSPTQLRLKKNGKMTVKTGSTSISLKDAKGSDFIFKRYQWFPIHIKYNLVNQTFRITVSGVEQRLNGVADLPWDSSSNTSEYGKFQIGNASPNSNLTLIRLDNFYFHTQGGIHIDAGTILRSKPGAIGGTNIHSHTQDFASGANGIDFINDAALANIPLIRSAAYPNPKTNDSLQWFDQKVQAILDAGAEPLFIQYCDPAITTYYKLNGSLGGTIGSNMVYLVKHYRDQFGLTKQHWEVCNEPDLTIDYKVQTAGEYADIFNSVHHALVQQNVRSHVVLMGPSIAYGYRQPYWEPMNNFRTQIMQDFLSRSHNYVDVVTYHTYSNESSSPYNLLNQPRHVDNKENPYRNVTSGESCADCAASDRGLGGLMAEMNNYPFPRLLGVGVTEHSTASYNNQIYQGLFNLMVMQFHLNNGSPYPGYLTSTFVFDKHCSDSGGWGHYTCNKTKDYSYLALYMMGALQGESVVAATTDTEQLNTYGNPHLIVTSTRDADNLFITVTNRSESSITTNVNVAGAHIRGAAQVYTMKDGITPAQGVTMSLGWNFQHAFPAYSATTIKIPVV